MFGELQDVIQEFLIDVVALWIFVELISNAG
jgi:hypothetical protein